MSQALHDTRLTSVQAVTMSEQEPRRLSWLLCIYRVPQEPAGRRTYVWRQLKQLGAVYLQQAAAIAPDRPLVQTTLAILANRIREFGGEVSLLETTSPTAAWEQETITRFNQARAEEYAELVENVERFEDEIARESRKGKFTFAELEELEADWEKLRQWRARIEARDFFAAPANQEAVEALARGRVALDAFATTVYAHEGVQDNSSSEPPPGSESAS
jgi:hypothetical protein